jgi:hypothetical protein
MPKFIKRHQYKNYRISHSENKKREDLGDELALRKTRLRHQTEQNEPESPKIGLDLKDYERKRNIQA